MDNKTMHEKVELFLKTLKSELEKQGISIPKFASQMNVKKVTVYAWLKKENVMSLEKYYKALEILGLQETIQTKE